MKREDEIGVEETGEADDVDKVHVCRDWKIIEYILPYWMICRPPLCPQ